MVTPTQIDLGAYYEGLTVQEMIYEVRRWLGQQPTDTARYTDADVITAMNFGQNRFAKLTACLTMPAVVTLKANRQNYRMPYNTLKVRAARYYYSNSKTDYDELKILRDPRKMQRLDSQYRGNTGVPAYAFPSYRSGNIQMFGVSPFPSTNGETWSGDDYGVLTSATGFTNAGNITGLHKSGYPSSAFLVDSAGRNLVTLGAMVGYPIYNVTDGSSGVITAIGDAAATNDKVTVTLTGGTDNDWDQDDSFQIPMSEYGVVLDAQEEETYTFTSYLGTIYDITGNTGNLVLDIARKPLPMSASLLTMYCEIPSEYQEAVIAWGVFWLGRSAYKGVTQEGKAKQGYDKFMEMVTEFNNEEYLEESDKGVEDRSDEFMI